jgi:hypothetical protein
VVLMVLMVGGGSNRDVDGDRISLEPPTNCDGVIACDGFVACDGIDLDMYDSSLHGRILRAEKGRTTSLCARRGLMPSQEVMSVRLRERMLNLVIER